MPLYAYEVSRVNPFLEKIIRCLSESIYLEIKLQTRCLVLQIGKGSLAVSPDRHDSARRDDEGVGMLVRSEMRIVFHHIRQRMFSRPALYAEGVISFLLSQTFELF